MAYTDIKGLAVSTTSQEALEAYERGLDLFLRWRSGSMEALDAAVACDTQFALAHCARAFIAWRMGRVDLEMAAHREAMALQDKVADEREHLHIQAVDAMHQGGRTAAYDLLEQVAMQHPDDRLAVRLLGLNFITEGNYQGGIGLARRSLEACPEEPQFQTMLGFFLEQSGYNEEGLEMSLRSMAQDPTNLYTYHAVGHAYHARGDYRNTLETFERAASLERYPHVLWHLAEAQAILGNAQLTHEYWASTTPPLPLFERIELLWRLEILRHTPSPLETWKELAAQGERLLEHADYLTIWMHHWIGLALARAGEVEKAQRQLAYLRQLPEGRASGHWSTLGAALLEGELAMLRGEAAVAVQLMAPAIEEMHQMGGGSREQKDIFKDVFLELQRRLGHVEQVMVLAQKRLVANPNHIPSLAALAWAYGQSGDTSLQRQVYRQLINRAAEAGLHPRAPELIEAQQALQDVP